MAKPTCPECGCDEIEYLQDGWAVADTYVGYQALRNGPDAANAIHCDCCGEEQNINNLDYWLMTPDERRFDDKAQMEDYFRRDL